MTHGFRGASLFGAELQGAWLGSAQLWGASLDSAQLPGRVARYAQLQGASLNGTQLQGASLQAAHLDATDLAGAWLWRTNAAAPARSSKFAAAIRLSSVSWEPSWRQYGLLHTWDSKAYQDLRTVINALPTGDLRSEALERIQRLDCASPDNPRVVRSTMGLGSSAELPPEATAWRKAPETAASADEKAYTEALVNALKELVCSGGDNAPYVVRGDGFQVRLRDAGAAASDLIGDLTNKDSKVCPVSIMLTDADRAKLLQIRRTSRRHRNLLRRVPEQHIRRSGPYKERAGTTRRSRSIRAAALRSRDCFVPRGKHAGSFASANATLPRGGPDAPA